MIPSWIRNPQDPADDHDWVKWFDNPRKYRGKKWSWNLEQWIEESNK